MSKTTKYTKKFKLMCVLKYLNGEYVESPLNINRHTFTNHVGEWFRLYNLHGEKGLDNVKQVFTVEQKEQMVRDRLRWCTS